MKRIWIAGCSGSGKTTLANVISEKLNIPVYHRDLITWDKNDNMRSEEEQISITKEITVNDTWIFEGARFTASRIDGRLDKCDTIIHLSINRFICLYRAFKRSYLNLKDNSIPKSQKQPVNLEIIKYILVDYPCKVEQREQVFNEAKQKGITVIILNNRKEVVDFCSKILNEKHVL